MSVSVQRIPSQMTAVEMGITQVKELSRNRADLRDMLDIVAADGHDRHALGAVLGPDAGELRRHVLDVRAVVADEHDQHDRLVIEVAELDGLARGRIGQREVGRAVADLQLGSGRGGEPAR